MNLGFNLISLTVFDDKGLIIFETPKGEFISVEFERIYLANITQHVDYVDISTIGSMTSEIISGNVTGEIVLNFYGQTEQRQTFEKTSNKYN